MTHKTAPTRPSKTALQKIHKAYKQWLAGAARRKVLLESANTNAEIADYIAIDAAEWKVVQIAFIKGTSYINSHDKWPLVDERAVVALLAGNRML